jgi:CHAT domain-containing protein
VIRIESQSESNFGSAQSAGKISINSTGGKVKVEDIYASSLAANRGCSSSSCEASGSISDANKVEITGNKGVEISQGIYTFSLSYKGRAGNGGDISLESTQGAITVGAIESFASTQGENQDPNKSIRGGNVKIVSGGDVNVTRYIYTSTSEDNAKQVLVSDLTAEEVREIFILSSKNPSEDDVNKAIIAFDSLKKIDQEEFERFGNSSSIQDYRATTNRSDLGRGGKISIEYGQGGKIIYGKPGEENNVGYIPEVPDRDPVSGRARYIGNTDLRCLGLPLCARGQGARENITVRPSVIPDPVIPDPVIPDPVIPDPGIPDPRIPDPGIPDPRIPDLDLITSLPEPVTPLLAPTASEILELESIEDNLTNEFARCLKLGSIPSKNLQQIRQVLQKSESKTNLKTALVYLTFDGSGSSSGGACERTPRDTDRLKIRLVTSQGIELPAFPDPSVTYANLRDTVENFRREIQQTNNATSYIHHSRQLYNWLIKPISSMLERNSINSLAFVPQSTLRSIPFAALSAGPMGEKGRELFLIEKMSISMMPSASLVFFINDERLRADKNYTEFEYTDLSKSKLWIMGASEFPNGLDPLPANFEARSLKAIWEESKSFLDGSFREVKLLPKNNGEREPDVRLIYLTTHGVFNDSQPAESYIYLGLNRKLTLQQIETLRLDAPPPPPIELMIFSACDTAEGTGSTQLGFAGAAVKSRVNSVMGGTFQIGARGTFALMSDFFSQLKNSKVHVKGVERSITKAEALRRAQISMLKGKISIKDGVLRNSFNEEFPIKPGDFFPGIRAQEYPYEFFHPGYWAGMSLVGSPW